MKRSEKIRLRAAGLKEESLVFKSKVENKEFKSQEEEKEFKSMANGLGSSSTIMGMLGNMAELKEAKKVSPAKYSETRKKMGMPI